MMKWEKTGRTVHENGNTEIRYEAKGTDLVIESRKRAIPHASGTRSWMFTSYFLIRPDGSEEEFYRLRDAKEAAERG